MSFSAIDLVSSWIVQLYLELSAMLVFIPVVILRARNRLISDLYELRE